MLIVLQKLKNGITQINPGITKRNFAFTQPSIRLSISLLTFQQ